MIRFKVFVYKRIEKIDIGVKDYERARKIDLKGIHARNKGIFSVFTESIFQKGVYTMYTTMTIQALQDTIEELIDQSSVTVVLRAIVQVCNEKAEHLRTNWQDHVSAQVWEETATTIEAYTL